MSVLVVVSKATVVRISQSYGGQGGVGRGFWPGQNPQNFVLPNVDFQISEENWAEICRELGYQMCSCGFLLGFSFVFFSHKMHRIFLISYLAIWRGLVPYI